MNTLTIIITIATYFLLLFSVSYLAGRKADNAGFFVGNRKSKWWVVAVATMGSFISGVTFVSVPGMVAEKGFSYLQMVMGFVVGQFVIAFILIPLFYRMNLVSVYQYLEDRFGLKSYKTGAWFFFISKMLGASVRLFLVCLTLQLLVFDPLGLPFLLNVVLTVFLVWLYTFRGGVKSIIWTDVLKSLCLVLSVGLCIYYVSGQLDLGFNGMLKAIDDSSMSQVFFFDDINDKRYFFKQFLAGIFTMIATTGLDQDMMQRNLSCRNYKDSQKNMMVSIVCQFFINLLFLMLGVLLYLFAAKVGIEAKGDSLFPTVATSSHLPVVVGVLFIVGLFSSAYSAAGSALTALTTSFTLDILATAKPTSSRMKARWPPPASVCTSAWRCSWRPSSSSSDCSTTPASSTRSTSWPATPTAPSSVSSPSAYSAKPRCATASSPWWPWPRPSCASFWPKTPKHGSMVTSSATSFSSSTRSSRWRACGSSERNRKLPYA